VLGEAGVNFLEVRGSFSEEIAVSMPGKGTSFAATGISEFPRRGIRFLTVDGNIANPTAMLSDESFALHEHAAGPTTGIVNAALMWFDHLHEQADHTTRRIEFAVLLAFGTGELA
jgi:hypothetical protein